MSPPHPPKRSFPPPGNGPSQSGPVPDPDPGPGSGQDTPAAKGVARSALSVDTVLSLLAEEVAAGGPELLLVGGYVRDRLLGLPGSKDIDLVSLGDGGVELFSRLASRLGWAPPQVFDHFGTAQIRGNGIVLELVRARGEQYDPASRKPSVRPGTLEEDLWRRDFTVNAIAQRLDGELLDLTGRGLSDLEAGVLDTPLAPAGTFAEDPLRMWRALRFVAQLDFSPSDRVVEALADQADRIAIVSVERIAVELSAMLLGKAPQRALQLAADTGLLRQTLPYVDAMRGVPQGGYHIYDVFGHSAAAVEAAPAQLLVRLAALYHDVGKPVTHLVDQEGNHTFHAHAEAGAAMAREELLSLRLGKELVENVARLVALHMRPIQYNSQFSDAAVRRLLRDAGGLAAPLLELARADTVASSYPDCHGLDELERRMLALEEQGRYSAISSPLSGDALMELAARRAGPWVGRTQRALVEAVLDGEIPAHDRHAARQWLLVHPELLSWTGDDKSDS